MLLPRLPYGESSSACPLADDAETVRVVDVEDRGVLARELGEGRKVGSVAGHTVDAVDADQAGRGLVAKQERLELVDVVVCERLQRRAAQGRELSTLVDGLVGTTVDEDRAAGGQQRDHGEVDERDRRQHEDVGHSEQLA